MKSPACWLGVLTIVKSLTNESESRDLTQKFLKQRLATSLKNAYGFVSIDVKKSIKTFYASLDSWFALAFLLESCTLSMPRLL